MHIRSFVQQQKTAGKKSGVGIICKLKCIVSHLWRTDAAALTASLHRLLGYICNSHRIYFPGIFHCNRSRCCCRCCRSVCIPYLGSPAALYINYISAGKINIFMNFLSAARIVVSAVRSWMGRADKRTVGAGIHDRPGQWQWQWQWQTEALQRTLAPAKAAGNSFGFRRLPSERFE